MKNSRWRQPGSSWAAYAAALWALVFAVLHLVWAAGWHVGLDPEQAQKAFDKTWFMVYDLVVAGMCAFAVPVALALAQPWGRRLPRWLVGLFAWAGTVLLVLRGGGTIIQTVRFYSRLHPCRGSACPQDRLRQEC